MLLTSLCAAALGQSMSDEVRLLRNPDIYGDKVVFVYASDLWLFKRGEQVARRLTSHAGSESYPKFSPDGKSIAFTASYDGPPNVYVIPSEGGEPKRLTFEPVPAIVRDWTPDGKKVGYISSYGNSTGSMYRMWMVPVDGGMPEVSKVQECFDLSFSPDGGQMAFNRVPSQMYNWRRYRGGTQGKLAFWDFATSTYTEVAQGREQTYFPMWVGEDVYYTSDKTLGTQNLYVYNTKTKRSKALTSYSDADVRWPSTDGKTIVFERNLKLHTFDIATGQVTGLDPRVVGDNLAVRPRTIPVSNAVESFALSPTGKRLAVVARGEVFSVPATSGSTRNVSKTPGGREQNVEWSNDGQDLLYLSDVSGEIQLMSQPQMGGEPKVIKTPAGQVLTGFAQAPKGSLIAYTTVDFGLYVLNPETGDSTLVRKDIGSAPGIEWGPDGKWLAYTGTLPNFFQAIFLYDVEKKAEHKVTSGLFTDNGVSFDLNGKYLYYVSTRSYSPGTSIFELGLWQNDAQMVYAVPLRKDMPNPMDAPEDEEPVKKAAAGDDGDEGGSDTPGFKVDIEGLEARSIVLPYPPASYGSIIGLNNGCLVYDGQGLTIFSFASRRPAPFLAGFTNASLNASRTKLAYQAGPLVGIVPIQPGAELGQGRVNLGDMTMVSDPAKEYRQMFWEAWRYERDNFYDKDMLGLDWKAIGDKYAAMLPYVGNRSDLDYIFGQLIGELGTGHAYVSPGPSASDPMSQTCGLLGADYVAEGNFVKMAKVYPGVAYDPATTGPLGAIGVNVKSGDYLMAVDGVPVTAKTGVTPLLAGKVGKKVTITVNSTPTMTGAKTYTVRPTSNESNLRYMTWVEERRQLVDKMSGGKLGYIHVPDTNVQGMIMFVRGFYSQTDKEGWVIDERYNGGGWLPTFFIEALVREMTNVVGPRHGADQPTPFALNGPKAMLINQYAGSGGDMFPYLFRQSKVGPLIGTRTWGGLVGIQGFQTLLDGGGITAPAFGIYDPNTGKWMAENTGVDPDMEIDDKPDLAAQGKDVQLEAAVGYLMKETAKRKQAKPRPAPPKVGGLG